MSSRECRFRHPENVGSGIPRMSDKERRKMLRASSTTGPSSTTRQSAAIPRSTGMLLAERQRAVSGLLSGIGEHARLRPPQRSPLIGRVEYESERDTGERSVEPATTSPSQGYPWNFLAIPVFALQA